MNSISIMEDNNFQSYLHLQYQICEGFFSKFSSSEEVYKYLVSIGTHLVVEREKITLMFKKI
jgi:hypothetical protein